MSAAAGRWLRLALDRRARLWAALLLLVLALLGTLVYLARAYEIDQVQRALERDNADAVQALRQGLSRNLEDLHRLASAPASFDNPEPWAAAAQHLLDRHREWLRLTWRDRALHPLASADSPFFAALAEEGRASVDSDLAQACALARKQSAPAYSHSRFVPQPGGLGEEVMDLCLPLMQGPRHTGYLVATYSLGGMLAHLLGPANTRRQSVAFTELDGTRLALHGAAPRGARPAFTSQQIVDLPGNALVLRMEGGRPLPDVFPNVLTALVTFLSIALVTVLVLLVRDFRARQKAESELAQALAFRKAMEDSLVTGLRARDLDGHITYVNPAFCAMVGFEPGELIGQAMPAPYWPPEHAHEYGQRQAVRMAGNAPPREGTESVFMRKDGTRFPVLIIEAPLITAQGGHTGWMSAVIDQTAQRRAEELSRASAERLQASARLATVGEMASLMSHELNQPLAAISSYATGTLNLLPGGTGATDGATLHDVRTALARIAEQAGRAGKVINSVHDLVRRRGSARQAVTPRALFDTVLPLVQLQARKLGATVQVDVPAELPAVWCEPTMIEQVLLNLARNGLQAMDEVAGPRVLRLQARALPVTALGFVSAVEFSVADSGSGISEAVAAELFTPFFTTKAEGMGLGLSLCRTVIEQHGSALQHQPQSPSGTVFSFRLPLAR